MRVDPVVLSPSEMRQMRHEILHWSYRQLSEAARVSVPQLCEYEKGIGRLREDQQRKCKAILLRGVRAHGSRIAELFSVRREVVASEAVAV
jgi:hypothetical protein